MVAGTATACSMVLSNRDANFCIVAVGGAHGSWQLTAGSKECRSLLICDPQSRCLSSSTHLHSLCAGLLTDSWERLRDSAAGALQQLPTPLPGLESPASVGVARSVLRMQL